ncbi:MAG: hypothetical protein FJX46_16390 [Alphaproteobacteria bacterium]|nr:hypothetical protein [Alphaproteobacteria bacterium]
MTRLLCIGNATLDRIWRVERILPPPSKTPAHDYAEAGGGMAANAAVAAARLGGEVAFWGRIGDDDAGDRILAEFEAEGIDTKRVRRIADCASPQAAILVDAQGERSIATYFDPRLADDGAWLPLDEVSGFDAILADVRWPEGAALAMKAARAAGKPAVLDADVAEREALSLLTPLASHAVFSEAGLRILTGIDRPREALARIGGTPGVTLGARGCLFRDGDGWLASAPPQVAVKDTTAAGDCFHGAFALALGEGRTLAEAARFANAAAALKCTRFGGRAGMPLRAEIEESP